MAARRDGNDAPFGEFDPGKQLADEHSPYMLDPEIDSTPAPPPVVVGWHLLAVFLGGAIGTGLRYAVIKAAGVPATSLPWQIMVINSSGAFVMGLFAGSLFVKRADLVTLRLFIAPGLLGGWTTYSSVIAATLTLAHSGRPLEAVLAMGVALVVPPLAALLGMVVTGWQWAGRRS